MMRFEFTIGHVPGKDLTIADTLSRAPTGGPSPADELLQGETSAFVKAVMQSLPATDQRLEEIKRHQKEDEVCQQITAFCETGWPDKHSATASIRPFLPMSAEFCIENGLLMRGNRIVIPPPLRRELLSKIHTGYQGITKCRERARQSVWWPGVSKELEELVRNCPDCCKAQKQRAQPLTPSPLPDLPWQKVATDLFEWKKDTFLVIVDYYLRYIEIARLNQPTADEVITRTKSMLARHGIPETVISDNGPQYSAEAYARFAQEYHFKHVTSSPYFPQSNGEAERAVSTIKELLKKSKDPYLALLAYRTTPLEVGYSPSELLMSRTLRSAVPTTRAQRAPRVPDDDAVRAKIKTRQKENFNSHHGARELPPLEPGDTVWLPDRRAEATVREEVGPQSFQVESSDGSYRRNRRDIIRLPDPSEVEEMDSTLPDETPTSAQPSGTSETIEPPNETIDPPNETTEPRRSSRASRPPERFAPSWGGH